MPRRDQSFFTVNITESNVTNAAPLSLPVRQQRASFFPKLDFQAMFAAGSSATDMFDIVMLAFFFNTDFYNRFEGHKNHHCTHIESFSIGWGNLVCETRAECKTPLMPTNSK